MRRALAPFLTLCVILSLSPNLRALERALPLSEIAREADLVFAGVVESQAARENERGMIVTDVVFTDVAVARASPRARQAGSDRVVLTYAGGAIAGVRAEVSGTPRFLAGHRYLVLAVDDGGSYANPVLGGPQGYFEVVTGADGLERVISPSGRRSEDGVAGPTRAMAPLSASEGDGAGSRAGVTGLAMTLTDFVAEIQGLAATGAEPPLLRRGAAGRFIGVDAGRLVSEPLPPARPPRLPADRRASVEGARRAPAPAPLPSKVAGGQLGACGYQLLPLVMEQVPTSWWSWQVNNDAMYRFNQFMDIYQYTPDDGSFGDNGQNEFCGWVDDATLQSVYGYTWSGGISMTITWTIAGFPCGVITQSDVMWNPAYNWTNQFSVSLGNPNVILLQPVDAHELGHTWGEQRGGAGWGFPETLDYDLLSVMHAYYYDVVEDGRGIHPADAYLVRAQYSNQTAVKNVTDVGVESYYAQNGLHNATTDKAIYKPGDAIAIQGLTVDQNSNVDLSDVRLRVYLSADRTILTNDIQMGSYWYWLTFSKEAYWSGDITTSIPATVAPGTYFVGAIVTYNGFTFDGLGYNNTVSLYQPITIVPPVTADFTATPTSGKPPLSVAFTDGSTGSPNAWVWDFGDGGSSNLQSPTHVYNAGGLYTVTLTASNAASSDTMVKPQYIRVFVTEEIVTGAGPDAGNAPMVRTWDHSTPPALVQGFSAYGAPQYGVNVASADISSGGVAEIMTGPGPGAIYGPQVRAFQPTGTAIAKVNYYAYGTLRYGVHPGGGDIDLDGSAEILTAPGPGPVFGPHVRAWNYDGVALSAIAKVSFFAYSTLKYGARAAGGDLDLDGYAEIATGAGAGAVFSPHVRAFNFDNATLGGTPVSLFAFASGKYGAAVATGDTDGDLRSTLIAAHGPDPNALGDVKGFDWNGGVKNVWTVAALSSTGGAEVASGDLAADGVEELLVAPGWGQANPSTVTGFAIQGTGGSPIPGLSFTAYTGQSYGTKLAVGETGTP